MKKLTILLLCLTFCFIANSQYQNPPDVKWNQVNTKHFRVVFPESITKQGIETAKILESVYNPAVKTLGAHPKKIHVFLFNQGTISNGYTTLVPRHIGFYCTPPQNSSLIGGTDWMQTLAIHEFRHAVQFKALNKNLIEFGSSVFGNTGATVLMNLAVPFWFFEGDAVCAETIYSSEGRGRLPSFIRDIRALELENKRYSYSKAYLGSYRNYYPDHYHLGYLMTSYMRKTFGYETMNKILGTTSLFPLPLVFSLSMNLSTSHGMRSTYRLCMDEFRTLWSEKTPVTDEALFTKKSLKPRSYTNYNYPYYTGNGDIIAMKSGFDNAPTLVRLENGTEKKLIEINPVDRSHSNGKQIVWSSYAADLRWGQRDYSNICMYDLETGNFKNLTSKGKYFAPAVSPDGKKIAAIEYGYDMICYLTILDAQNGNHLRKFQFNDGDFARMPSWSEDGKIIAVTITSGQYRKLSVINTESDLREDIIPFSIENFANPVFFGDYILFNSPATGTDAIHAIHTLSKQRFIVCQSPYGTYNVSVSNDKSLLIFQNYTTLGHEISEMIADTSFWNKFKPDPSKSDSYFMHLVKEEEAKDIFTNPDPLEDVISEVRPYRPILKSIRIHSWAPYPVTNGIGFNITSNDFLNTTTLTAGINYFTRDFAHREFLDISYAGIFPVLNAGFSAGRTFVSDETDSTLHKAREKLIYGGFAIPLDFSKNTYTTNLSFGANINYIKLRTTVDDTLRGIDMLSPSVNVSFSRTKQVSYRDLFPEFAQELFFTYWNSPFRGYRHGYRYLASGRLIFPGLLNHHSLILTAGIERSSPLFREGIYQLTTDLEFVRGYMRPVSDMVRKGMIEYTFPVLYPDLAISQFFYMKRISTNLFYDNALVTSDNETEHYSSAGIDLNFTVHLLSFVVPFDIGIRYSYLIKDDDHHFNLLFFGVAF